MFEIKIKDEFLPIYTHNLYNKIFKENSAVVQVSPERGNGQKNNRNSGLKSNNNL